MSVRTSGASFWPPTRGSQSPSRGAMDGRRTSSYSTDWSDAMKGKRVGESVKTTGDYDGSDPRGETCSGASGGERCRLFGGYH